MLNGETKNSTGLENLKTLKNEEIKQRIDKNIYKHNKEFHYENYLKFFGIDILVFKNENLVKNNFENQYYKNTMNFITNSNKKPNQKSLNNQNNIKKIKIISV